MDTSGPVATTAATTTVTAAVRTKDTAAQPDPTPKQDKKTQTPRPARPNYAQLHAKPLPLQTSPLPAFHPTQPLSLLRLAYALLNSLIYYRTSHPEQALVAYYSASTRSVHVTDHATARALWESGFFGKGSLSRSEPEWLEREKKRLGLVRDRAKEVSAEITRKRREERRDAKRERARLEREALEEQLRKEGRLQELVIADSSRAREDREEKIGEEKIGEGTIGEDTNGHATEPGPNHAQDTKDAPVLINQEHLQLNPSEAFFLTYGLGNLVVINPLTQQPLSNMDLLTLFRRTSFFPPLQPHQPIPTDDPFILNYVVYHHFRSLGWVVRPGIKFSVDLLLYNRGPVFSHAEFAVLIVPDYSDARWSADEDLKAQIASKERNEWWWMHAVNRVQNQVRKALMICYVEVPPPGGEQRVDDIGALLRSYRVREFVVRRWTANRNR